MALQFTPNQKYKFVSYMYDKFEEQKLPLQKVDLDEDITFFNNKREDLKLSAYDQFFQYTRMLPLWDERRKRDNRQHQPDVWDCINRQAKDKAVPPTTTMAYGRRIPYDPSSGTHNRQAVIKYFYNRNGMPLDKEPLRFSEDTGDVRL